MARGRGRVNGKPLVIYTLEHKKEVVRRIEAVEFRSMNAASAFFGIPKGTLYAWLKQYGTEDRAPREYKMPASPQKTGKPMRELSEDKLKEKWKDHPFVEPDPGVESFRTEKDALEYYKLRAEYLENLYMLADSPTEVKKKVLRQLDERIREKMAGGKTSG